MDVKELMIDDWVLYDNEPHKIQEILYDEVTIERWPKSEGDIEPIPITTEILEKNGFKPVKRIPYRYSWLQDSIREWRDYIKIEFGPNGEVKRVMPFFWNEGYGIYCNIHYVHELQHAIRLCGIEKEIIL